MGSLTPREIDVYNFIFTYHNENGYSPSIREIAKGVHLSSTLSITRHIQNLCEKGYLEFTPKVARSIVLSNNRRSEHGNKMA